MGVAPTLVNVAEGVDAAEPVIFHAWWQGENSERDALKAELKATEEKLAMKHTAEKAEIYLLNLEKDDLKKEAVHASNRAQAFYFELEQEREELQWRKQQGEELLNAFHAKVAELDHLRAQPRLDPSIFQTQKMALQAALQRTLELNEQLVTANERAATYLKRGDDLWLEAEEQRKLSVFHSITIKNQYDAIAVLQQRVTNLQRAVDMRDDYIWNGPQMEARERHVLEDKIIELEEQLAERGGRILAPASPRPHDGDDALPQATKDKMKAKRQLELEERELIVECSYDNGDTPVKRPCPPKQRCTKCLKLDIARDMICWEPSAGLFMHNDCVFLGQAAVTWPLGAI